MTPAALAALHAACFTTPRPWTEAEFAALAGDPAITVTLAPGGAGFAVTRQIGDEAELLTICVAPAHRRTGAGRHLLADTLEGLRRNGATNLFLEVAADNTAARALYASEGFTEAGRRKGYYRRPDGARTDALVLRRAL